jgi:tRNA U34 5-carboxymethylaminomethyl modifying GTPase MnmE/TrmE
MFLEQLGQHEDTLVLNGIFFRFIDTAGLRETKDELNLLVLKRLEKK